MKRNAPMKKAAAPAVCLSLLLAVLLACSGCQPAQSAPQDWDTTIDITDIFNEELRDALDDNEELLDLIDIGDFTIDVTVSLNDEGDYELTVDERALSRTAGDVIKALLDGMEEYQASGTGDAGRLVGTWEATVDCTQLFTDSFYSGLGDDDLADFFSFGTFTLKLVMSLQDNGTFRITVDEAALTRTIDDVMEVVKDGLANYLDYLIQEEGLDMTVEELLAMDGYTLDSYFDEFVYSSIDMDEFMDDLDFSGTYEVENGMLLLSDGSKLSYELSGTTLTLRGDILGDPVLGDTFIFTKK